MFSLHLLHLDFDRSYCTVYFERMSWTCPFRHLLCTSISERTLGICLFTPLLILARSAECNEESANKGSNWKEKQEKPSTLFLVYVTRSTFGCSYDSSPHASLGFSVWLNNLLKIVQVQKKPYLLMFSSKLWSVHGNTSKVGRSKVKSQPVPPQTANVACGTLMGTGSVVKRMLFHRRIIWAC